MLTQPRERVAEVGDIPGAPGVYARLREGEPVYPGKAAGRGGLRERLGKHLETGVDLSRSSLRRNVAEMLLGLPTSVTRARPTQVSAAQAAAVKAWIAQCELAWQTYPDASSAEAAETALHHEWLPPLSKR